MRTFAELYQRLDRSTGTADKQAAIADFLDQVDPASASWGIWLLSGGRLRGLARSGELRDWIVQASGLPAWLIEDSYSHVGDLAETCALLLPEPAGEPPARSLQDWIETVLLPLRGADESARREVIVGAWLSLPFEQRLVFTKLLTGALRIGVAQGLVQRVLAARSGLPVATIAQRLLGNWQPSAEFQARLLSPESQPGDRAQPYPFFLASPLEKPVDELGPLSDWQLEWKWDGIRLQLLRRDGEIALWSRGEERLDGRFPEIEQAAAALPDGCVLDGELLAWAVGAEQPLPFSALQTRIQRRKPGPKALREAPLRLLAYDLLEFNGADLRERPLAERRAQLGAVIESLQQPAIGLSPLVEVANWRAATELREQARERGVEGLMLKQQGSPYLTGRRRGHWWKWKIDPLTIDAVLIYAQAGHGRRSNLYTDYTFALWQDETLVPVAKAYSGLSDAEIGQLDRWIRSHTLERFGPVRSVQPLQVFELAFEGVNRSPRHKSGIAVRFPRILRWRQDKPAGEADRLDTLAALAR
ncbi:MAG: ATP-dependent DNA ligase [Xanthomonadales bacterium]|nr:ATP-dependent DNA ligase [Xanthomonadales bacterium]